MFVIFDYLAGRSNKKRNNNITSEHFEIKSNSIKERFFIVR